MKKKLLIVLMVLVLCFTVLLIGFIGDEPLSPSAEKALAFVTPEVAPENNAYVGLAELPSLEATMKRDLDFYYGDPCRGVQGNHKNCMERMLADETKINDVFQKNIQMIELLALIQKKPEYVNNSSIKDVWQSHKFLREISRLIGVKAMIDIKNGDLEAGLTALEADLNFFIKICQSEYIDTLDLLISHNGISGNLQQINKIIEDETINISGHEDRLRAMLNLGFSAGQAMGNALEFEKRAALPALSNYLDGKIPAGFNNDLESKFVLFFSKKNMTLNLAATHFDNRIQGVKQAPALNFPDFYNNPAIYFVPDLTLKGLYKKNGLFFYKNYGGEHLAAMAIPAHRSYWVRLNDEVVYSHLLRAQLELRQMPERPENIDEALAGLGSETWNPYTGKPFQWDKGKNTIWTKSAREGKLEVRVIPGRNP